MDENPRAKVSFANLASMGFVAGVATVILTVFLV